MSKRFKRKLIKMIDATRKNIDREYSDNFESFEDFMDEFEAK